MAYEMLFLGSLSLTAALECLIALILKKYAGGRLGLTCGYGRLLAVVALASCLTLPYVWFVFPAYLPHGIPYAVISELFAFAVEALWYVLALKISVRQAFMLSAVANGFSFMIGLFVFHF